MSADQFIGSMAENFLQILQSPIEGLPKEQHQALAIIDVFMQAMLATGHVREDAISASSTNVAKFVAVAYEQATKRVDKGSRIILPY